MKRKNGLRIICGLLYAVTLLLGVIYFEFRAGFLADGMFSTLSAYISVVFIACITGYKIAHWYVPIENSKPYTEFFLVPVLTITSSSILAGLCFGVFSKILGMSEYSIAEVLALGMYSAIVFIMGVWPVLLVCSAVVSALMCRIATRF